MRSIPRARATSGHMAVAVGGFSAVLTALFALRPVGRRVPRGVSGAFRGEEFFAN